MNNTTETPPVKSGKIEVAVFELSNRTASGFVLEGSEDAGMPIVLDCPDARRIMPTSMFKNGNGVTHIRHIKGVDTIELAEQKKSGHEFNNQRDDIWIYGGRLSVRREGMDVGLFDFLRSHSNNSSNKNRIDGAEDIFHEVKVQEFQRKTLSSTKALAKALGMVNDLYEENATGGIESFNEERIDFLCSLFGVTGEETYEGKLIVLKELAESRPDWFTESVANGSAMIRVNLKQAISMDVVSLDGPGASFKKTGVVFKKLKESKPDARFDELVTYLQSKQGESNYEDMQIQLDAAKEGKLGV